MLLTNCTPTLNTRGNFVDYHTLDKIVVGKTSSAEVQLLLGPPSSQEIFVGRNWYYIGEQTQTKSFLKPKVIERRLIIFKFDDKGILQSMEKVKKEGYEVSPVSDQTPTYGRDPSLLAEVLGNIGRYEQPKDSRKGSKG